MTVKSHLTGRKWIVLLTICLTTAVITELPYLRWALYEPLREWLGQTNTEFGASMSLFGIVAAIGYIPGGWIADRVSHRKMFAISSILCGLIGFWFATCPSYIETMIIHVLWAITNITMFWPVMTKAVAMLEDAKGQGKVFGLFEGIRGIILVGLMAVLMQIFERFGGIQMVIVALSVFSILCGIIAFLFMEDNVAKGEKSENTVLRDMLAVVKIPAVWLVAGVIFTIYLAYNTSSYMSPYVENVLGMTAVVAGYITILRKDITRIVAAPLSGWISTKMDGACTKVIGGFCVIMIAAIAGLMVVPEGSSMLIVAIVLMLISSFAIYGMRGMYYAIIGEIGTPTHIYGAVAGWASFIGFLPDAFNASVCGVILDAIPGAAGYRVIFGYMLATLVVCLILVLALLRLVNKAKKGVNIFGAAGTVPETASNG
ncbi:MAG TPA: MFS transporter [Candidatus Fournierella pullicola]|uniref:MFS transporter n=1 Tax=Candidatus Allofournierella pullicola TaxID=2838596 RepID=A0A9D1V4K2_9FIRM|nr:MFS transporter [Candidatus Fournierella pullicola]